MEGIECALWPVLYPFTSWCESILKGNISRDSILASFRSKLLSPIRDYNDNFALLQHHYDRWMYKTIGGALHIGKSYNASPHKSLETKHFTVAYWQWQNRFLHDAVLQYGQPSFFLTISPYEWTFPRPAWFEESRDDNTLLPTKSGPIETFHITHIVDQICRGYLTRINDKTWESSEIKHVFHSYKNGKPGNVKCVFYRFEFQKRGTPHVHMLVWLEKISEIDITRIKATIPTDDGLQAFLATDLQPSDRPAPFLHVREEESLVSNDGQLFLKHLQSDADLNLRAYVDTVLGALKCRMDVQAADDRSALLKYCTTYVSKLQEDQKCLRSITTNTFQAAWYFLIDQKPLLPEMAVCFTNIRMSQCNLSRVKLVPPTEEYFEKNVMFSLYCNRDSCDEGLTSLQYWRLYAIQGKGEKPKLRTSAALVGVHYKHIFNPRFFWEYTILNTAFRDIDTVRNEYYETLPDNIRSFSWIITNHNEFLLKKEAVSKFLSAIGYNQSKIDEFARVTKGYATLYYRAINQSKKTKFTTDEHDYDDSLEMNPFQEEIFMHLAEKLAERERFSEKEYSNDDSTQQLPDESDSSESDSSSSSETEGVQIAGDLMQCTDDSIRNNMKFTSITGYPGTGKSFVMKKVVSHAIDRGMSVLFCHPQAYGAREMKNNFPSKVTHSMRRSKL